MRVPAGRGDAVTFPTGSSVLEPKGSVGRTAPIHLNVWTCGETYPPLAKSPVVPVLADRMAGRDPHGRRSMRGLDRVTVAGMWIWSDSFEIFRVLPESLLNTMRA